MTDNLILVIHIVITEKSKLNNQYFELTFTVTLKILCQNSFKFKLLKQNMFQEQTFIINAFYWQVVLLLLMLPSTLKKPEHLLNLMLNVKNIKDN